MSEAYENDLAQEQAIFDTIDRAAARAAEAEPPPNLGGRPYKADPVKLVAWRQAKKASIRETARRWRVSEATVKRWSRDYAEAAKRERDRYEQEQWDRTLAEQEYGYAMLYARLRGQHLYWAEFQWFGRCERARGTDREAATDAARESALDTADAEFQDMWRRTFGEVPGSAMAGI